MAENQAQMTFSIFPTSSYECYKCKRDTNGIPTITCTFCKQSFCEYCFQESYFVKIQNDLYYPFKMKQTLDLFYKTLFLKGQYIYYICSEFCLVNFPLKHKKIASS